MCKQLVTQFKNSKLMAKVDLNVTKMLEAVIATEQFLDRPSESSNSVQEMRKERTASMVKLRKKSVRSIRHFWELLRYFCDELSLLKGINF